MTGPQRLLSLVDTTAITVGIVIGAGIFSFPGLVAGMLGRPDLIIAVWVAGGLLSLIGALCFAELTTAFPDPGGEYHFLYRAYGRDCAFMYGWARMTVIQTGSIATLAFVFGDYAQQVASLGEYGTSIYAVLSIIVLTGVNVFGLREAKWVQNLLEAGAVFGLVVLIVVGFSVSGPATPAPPSGDLQLSGLGLAMIFVLFTYGGWNEAAYISAEVKDGHRNMTRALLYGLGLVTLLYVLINIAYLHALGVDGMAKSKAIGADVMRPVLGEGGAIFMTILIIVVVLTSINVTILTGARTSFALGRDFAPFRFLAQWSQGRAQPVRALLLQGGISLVLVGIGAASRGGVGSMVVFLSPVFWLFFLLVGISLIVLRRREPNAERPFRVPFYPITPIIFCLSSAYLLYATLDYASHNYAGIWSWAGLVVLALGVPFLIWIRQTQKA
ncbi:MAG: amino acid permease [Rhodospirillales bacterium]|nr:amino acid permease [Rhodospirillales bacterium]